jgi:DNA-binding transcriptional ArsR family regulator
MGITKTKGFSLKTIDRADLFKALGHPARLSIIEMLVNTPNCINSEIVDEIPLAQPTISKHLAELKNAGLIQGNILDKNICYCINIERWNQLKELIQNFSEQVETKNLSC